MSNDTEPYARVYHAKLQREFPEVWADDALLSGWLRLHSVADASWPMHPPIPRSIRPRVLARLVGVGIVIVEGETYTTRGLDAERSSRSKAARDAAAKRWQSVSNAGAYADAMPTRPEPNKAEPNNETREAIDRIVDCWLSVKYRLPTEKQRAFLHAYLQAFDQTGEARAERAILTNPQDPIAAMKAELADFRGERAKALEAEVAKPAPRRRPGLPESTQAILAEMKLLERESA